MKSQTYHQAKFFNSIAIKYHKYTENNLNSIIKFNKITKNYISGHVLDIGSGGIIGYETKNAKSITIADISSELLQNPKHLVINRLKPFKSKKLKSKIANVMNMPFQHAKFDTVIMVTTAHHLSQANKTITRANINKALKEINRVLKVDGTFVIHECFLHPIAKLLQEVLFNFAFKTLMYFDKPLPYFMSEKQLTSYLISAGFTVLKIKQVNSDNKVYLPLFPSISPPGWLWDMIQPSKTYICKKTQ